MGSNCREPFKIRLRRKIDQSFHLLYTLAEFLFNVLLKKSGTAQKHAINAKHVNVRVCRIYGMVCLFQLNLFQIEIPSAS